MMSYNISVAVLVIGIIAMFVYVAYREKRGD